MKSLEGAHVVVTGGANGIGRALARESARRGARVVIGDIRGDEADTVARDIIAAGGQALACPLDVTDETSFAAMSALAEAAFGPVNVVFSNAGVFTFGPIERTSAADFKWAFDVNVVGAFNCMTTFAPKLRATAASGALAYYVVTGSENSIGLPPIGAFTAYTASKHAVLGLCDGLRRDLEGSGVGVSILCPGVVNTMLWDSGRTRQDRYGGPRNMPPAIGEGMKMAQSPDETAHMTFEGMEAGDFMILTNPDTCAFARTRIAQIEDAMARIERRAKPA